MTNSEKVTIEGLITYDEASFIFSKMKNDKSPGSDSFTVNFFKMFWKKIGHFVVRSLNYAYLTDSLSITHARVL